MGLREVISHCRAMLCLLSRCRLLVFLLLKHFQMKNQALSSVSPLRDGNPQGAEHSTEGAQTCGQSHLPKCWAVGPGSGCPCYTVKLWSVQKSRRVGR